MMARLFIGGTFREADKVEPVIEAAARSALDGRRSTPATERADALNRFADALQSRAADTNELCTRENGMPIRLSRGANGVFPATLLRYYAIVLDDADLDATMRALKY
jgi:aldehyde dehydrogenase (NAD+)